MAGTALLFVLAADPKMVKNCLDIYLSPQDGDQEQEVERLTQFGARRIDISQGQGK